MQGCIGLLTCNGSGTCETPWSGIVQLGTTASDTVNAVATDSNGNVYVAGVTSGTLPTQTSAGGDDAFIVKFSFTGAWVWTRQFGTSLGDGATGVAVDASDNVYVTGYTNGTFPAATSAGQEDGFVAEYDSGGTQQWLTQFGSTSFDQPTGVAVDTSGRVYVVGYTSGALASGISPPAGGYPDSFVAQFINTDGSQNWVDQIHATNSGGDTSSRATAVAIAEPHNAYVVGYTQGVVDPTNITQAPTPGPDFYVAKYTSSSSVRLWTKQFEATTTVNASTVQAATKANAVATDASGNAYVVGQTAGNLGGESNSGPDDAFVAQIDGAGNAQWLHLFGTSASDWANGVAIDSTGNVYIAGATQGALQGNTNPNPSVADVFLVKYTSAGASRWEQQFGSTASDIATSVAIGPEDNAYVAGDTSGGLGGNINAGQTDLFVAKYSSDGTQQ